jgi:hypothetical protein
MSHLQHQEKKKNAAEWFCSVCGGEGWAVQFFH